MKLNSVYRLIAGSSWHRRLVRSLDLMGFAKPLYMRLKGLAVSLKFAITGCPGVCALGVGETRILVCSRSKVECERCPRFHSFGKSCLCGEALQCNHPLTVSEHKTNLRDRDWKYAEIHDLHRNPGVTSGRFIVLRDNFKFGPVSVERPPEIQDTKDGANESNAECDGFLCEHIFRPNSQERERR